MDAHAVVPALEWSQASDLPALDKVSAARWVSVLRQTVYRYFHPTIIGTENLPATGRGFIIGCHSGVLPYDAACLFVAVHDATGRFAHFVGDNMFGRNPAVARFLARQGAVVGRPAVVEQLLENDELVQLYPGGALDMMRPYIGRRYRVLPHRGFAPGKGGYIKIALRTQTPIIPVAIVGAEEAHVYLGNLPLLARAVGLPYAPIVAFPFPLPTKFFIRFGDPIHLRDAPAAASDQPVVDRLNRMVRHRVQTLIDDTRGHRHGIIFGRYG